MASKNNSKIIILEFTSDKRLPERNDFMPAFVEVFNYPFGQSSEQDAQKILEEIRKNFSVEDGWIELASGIIPYANGKWYTWRCHMKKD